jgi:hypothetical protein
MIGRPSGEAVARWNSAYAEQTAALFAAMRTPADVAAVRRLAAGYRAVAEAWRGLAADPAVPIWARHAATVAAEEFTRRARVEDTRADSAEQSNQEGEQ